MLQAAMTIEMTPADGLTGVTCRCVCPILGQCTIHGDPTYRSTPGVSCRANLRVGGQRFGNPGHGFPNNLRRIVTGEAVVHPAPLFATLDQAGLLQN